MLRPGCCLCCDLVRKELKRGAFGLDGRAAPRRLFARAARVMVRMVFSPPPSSRTKAATDASKAATDASTAETDSGLLERRLRAAIAAKEVKELYEAVKEAKKASSTPKSLLKEAEAALMLARRVADKLKMVESALQMGGLNALERAIAAARSDSNVPAEALALAESTLADRRFEQRYWKWMDALQAAQQKELQAKALKWKGPRARIPDWTCPKCAFVNNGPMEFCEQCEGERPPLSAADTATMEASERSRELKKIEELGVESMRRLGDPDARPPAWLHFLWRAYELFPPPGLSAAQLNKAKAALRTAGKSSIARTVLRVLMDGVRMYHPCARDSCATRSDRNRTLPDPRRPELPLPPPPSRPRETPGSPQRDPLREAAA